MMALIDIVSSKGKAEILRLLFGVESEEFHLRELARRSDLAVRTIQQELTRLKGAGLVTARRDGNRVYYRANQNNPVYPDLRNLVLKTAGLINLFHNVLKQANIRIAFVFGSIASGSAVPQSDIDLMVIGDVGLRQLSPLLSRLTTKVEREINSHVFTPSEFAERKRTGDHFVSSVLAAPRLFVIGSEHELGELAK